MSTSLLTAVLPLLAAAFPAIAPHPHVPRTIALGGAGGKIAISYFTVPYNGSHLAGLQPGFRWHLGFATLHTEVPLVLGETEVPAGRYKLDALLGDGGWDFALQDLETLEQLRRAERRAGNSAAAKERYERMKAEASDAFYRLEGRDFAMVDAEHLSIVALHRGFERPSIQSEEPSGGISFSLRISFGDIHRELDFAETYARPAADALAEKAKKKEKSDG